MRAWPWLIALGCLACDDGGSAEPPQADEGPDAAAIVDAGPDAAEDAATDAAPDMAVVPPGTPVPVDLAPYLEGGAGGPARAFRSATVEDLVGGPAATGQVGDYVIENDRVRFVVEQPGRVIGPCPYGGNVIDADVRRPEGAPGRDAVGEICLFAQLAQTLAVDAVEIMRDGSDGGAAVLAVTGHMELLDFINVNGLIAGFAGGAIRIGFDTETLLPLTVTVYYVLRPGDDGLRVITALRNDGSEPVHTPVGHLIDSGGEVSFFNPAGPFGGFGYRGLSPEALQADPLVMLGFQAPEAGHAYVPVPDPALEFSLPRGGSYVSVAGVAVSLLGNDTVLPTLLSQPAAHPNLAGILHLEPGASQALHHWHLVGGADPARWVDAAWGILGVDTGRISGQISDGAGPAAGAHVSAIDPEGRTLTQSRTDAEGRYAMDVPVGPVQLRVWRPGSAAIEGPDLMVAAGDELAEDIELATPATLRVRVRRPDGTPTPAKITVLCDGDCPNTPIAADRDVTLDGPITGTAVIVFTDMDGEAAIPLAAGAYKIAVSRGMTWSVWPADAIESGGHPVALSAGETVELEAEIAAVNDTAGALSADFHVHAINSPDSPVPLRERVRTFLGEGVDVLVSTDHDFITDFGPTIEAMGAGAEVASVVGVELTTFDYGHYNGFPVPRDPASRNGGAWDWAGGPGLGHTPKEIFEWFHSNPGEQVVQVNHPAGGYFSATGADVLRGTTGTDGAVFRLPAQEGATEEDTGLWSERFTAFEIYNGLGRGDFWRISRWWLQMVGRGFTPTATAVSDTHKRVASQAGTPRSFLFVPPEADRPANFDAAALTAAANAGRLVGSSGPFLRVDARSGAAVAGLGETLAVADGQVTVRVRIQTPAWMQVDTVSLFHNLDGEALSVGPGDPPSAPLTPTVTAPVGPMELVEVAPGHGRREATVELPLPVAADGYVVVVVTGDEGPSMFPVVHKESARPIAFSNPIYLDADGGGYDHPPLAALAATRAKARPASAPPRPIEAADVERLIEQLPHH